VARASLEELLLDYETISGRGGNSHQRNEGPCLSGSNIMLSFLSAGIVLGLSSGFSPGPLLALVISQTLRHGIKEGVKVAVAPLLTDFPIMLVSLFVLTRFVNYRPIFGGISIIGGLFVLKLAYESLRTKDFGVASPETAPRSLSKGALVNALNPNPYIFWLTVGAPAIIKGWAAGPFVAVMFVAAFLGCLVGAKVSMAVLTIKSRHLLNDRAYRYLMRVLGAFLVLFGFLLLKDGLKLIGVPGL
jgi:threonine/homoserine/homoserine lactone efflux protein